MPWAMPRPIRPRPRPITWVSNHHHQITEASDQGLHLWGQGITRLKQKSHLALPPAEVTEFLIAGFKPLNRNNLPL